MVTVKFLPVLMSIGRRLIEADERGDTVEYERLQALMVSYNLMFAELGGW